MHTATTKVCILYNTRVFAARYKVPWVLLHNGGCFSSVGLLEGRRVVTRSKTGSLVPKQFTDSVLPSVSLKTALKASLADFEANDPGRMTRSRTAVNASFVVSSLPGFFRLGKF